MRTVTFIGVLMIGGALRNIAKMSSLKEHAMFFAIILMACVVMDVAEFIKKITK